MRQDINVSDPTPYETDSQWALFERLREKARDPAQGDYPQDLKGLEPLTGERIGKVMDGLPIGKPFN
ncbi:MAG: hypothetical protein JJ934_04610 [Pseudomonadales bacterium]|nr:hypothetical protein [Pseudomonadales bacterium]MBO6656151.1 hypothetical protein [Pseudomonadales bacterium]MBO6703676.1 hypothetical protein [Pseudomonadales bacterium]MBO6823780.1 hypothetical protein [Pseudomonadales bacterium]MBO7004267.1 hypothetical protein [Pseudomonadales bacterium]